MPEPRVRLAPQRRLVVPPAELNSPQRTTKALGTAFHRRSIPPPHVQGTGQQTMEPKETPHMNIDNFVIAMRRDRDAAHRARAAAGKETRTSPLSPRVAPAPVVARTDR